jgi:hypothetical protein
MSASPDRPTQPLAVIADGPGDLDREQLLDLVAGQRDQPGRWRPPVGRPCHRPRCAQAGSIGAGSRSIHPLVPVRGPVLPLARDEDRLSRDYFRGKFSISMLVGEVFGPGGRAARVLLISRL